MYFTGDPWWRFAKAKSISRLSLFGCVASGIKSGIVRVRLRECGIDNGLLGDGIAVEDMAGRDGRRCGAENTSIRSASGITSIAPKYRACMLGRI